jgi:hypothetical protein
MKPDAAADFGVAASASWSSRALRHAQEIWTGSDQRSWCNVMCFHLINHPAGAPALVCGIHAFCRDPNAT